MAHPADTGSKTKAEVHAEDIDLAAVRGRQIQCRFRWERHSVAFWDNRCALHRATLDYHPAVRHAHRVTIQGDRPY
jgi:alpha-ketoglutarate-dependent taurine dioxygenase